MSFGSLQSVRFNKKMLSSLTALKTVKQSTHGLYHDLGHVPHLTSPRNRGQIVKTHSTVNLHSLEPLPATEPHTELPISIHNESTIWRKEQRS